MNITSCAPPSVKARVSSRKVNSYRNITLCIFRLSSTHISCFSNKLSGKTMIEKLLGAISQSNSGFRAAIALRKN